MGPVPSRQNSSAETVKCSYRAAKLPEAQAGEGRDREQGGALLAGHTPLAGLGLRHRRAARALSESVPTSRHVATGGPFGRDGSARTAQGRHC